MTPRTSNGLLLALGLLSVVGFLGSLGLFDGSSARTAHRPRVALVDRGR